MITLKKKRENRVKYLLDLFKDNNDSLTETCSLNERFIGFDQE